MDVAFHSPLSCEQRRMWLLVQMHGSLPAFHERGAAWLDGELDVALLREAVAGIARRHEPLRTTFALVASRVRSYVSRATRTRSPR